MSDEFSMIETVKVALGIAGDYLDGTISLYVDEVNEYLASAGVPASVIGTQQTAGVVTRGVADLWNYGGGAGVLSSYFYERAIQLAKVGGNGGGDGAGYTLPAATTTTLGGVMVGFGLKIDANGVLSLDIPSAAGVSF